jgi:chemotaxis protein methyltransferase CheR
MWTSLVRSRVGLHFDESRRFVLMRAVSERSRALGLHGTGEYLARVSVQGASEEWQALLELLVTQETSFFRDEEAFAAFGSTVLPALVASRADRRPLHVWSAGCSSGEEAYSLAMVVHEVVGDLPFTVWGTDIGERAIETARAGVYSVARLARCTPARRDRYVEPAGHDRRFRTLSAQLRGSVRFTRADLFVAVTTPMRYDVIWCRNVLMYFDARERARLLTGLAQCLATDGVLILGPGDVIDGAALGLVRLSIDGIRAWRRLGAAPRGQ